MTLKYKDLAEQVKPSLFVDEFESKIADDSEIVVLSFLVRNANAALDLVNWFEKGYSYVIDADNSPGEVYLNWHLVYVEIKRRTALIEQIKELLTDLETLTEHTLEDWVITHNEKETHYDEKKLTKLIDLSPHVYRINHEEELNEMRLIANIPIKSTINKADLDPELEVLMVQSGLI